MQKARELIQAAIHLRGKGYGTADGRERCASKRRDAEASKHGNSCHC
jgi:hypothetical protein